MNSPLFDGSFRSRPQVSLRGESRHGVSSNKLIENAHQLREERELLRKRILSATKIQSAIRGYRVRAELFNNLRSQFDVKICQCTSHTHLINLTSHLLMYYNEAKDHMRLISLCQKWIQLKQSLLVELATPTDSSLHTLCRLLTLCLYSLQSNPHQPLANCLRIIEVYMSDTTQDIATDICNHLLNKGYFLTLRHIIETRLPPIDNIFTSHPLAISILNYIYKIIELNTNYVAPLLWELLAPPLSIQLCYCIVPALAKPHLLSVEILIDVAIQSCDQLMMSLTLCYCIVLLAEPVIGELSDATINSLLILINKTFESNQKPVHKELNIEEDDPNEDMELDPLGGDISLMRCIIDKLNAISFVNRLCHSKTYNSQLLESLCSTCYYIMNQCNSPYQSHLICSLSFSSQLIKQIWLTINGSVLQRSFGPSIKCIDHLCNGMSLPSTVGVALLHLLMTFCNLLYVSLGSLHDEEVESIGPLSLAELGTVSLKLRDLFVVLHLESHLHNKGGAMGVAYFRTTSTEVKPHPAEWAFLANWVCRLLRQLHERNVRLNFVTSDSSWSCISLGKVPPELFIEQDDDTQLMFSNTAIKHAELLKKAPFVFPFFERVTFLHKLIAHSRTTTQGRLQDFMIGPAINITARRTHLYEDAFSELNLADLRSRLRVNLINAHGLDEAGIDGGGLFREFLSETIKTGYDPNRGFFVTSHDGALYPNPQVHLVSDDYHSHYKFLGGLLGKALYEHMLVELPFAPFFIRKLTTAGRGWVETHHLSSLDPELYHHLLSLKHHDIDNIEELGLDFTVLSDEYGQTKVIELIPGGSNISVTESNVVQYIHLLARYHLNIKLDKQFQSFRVGVNNVVPLLWLTLFNEHELQTLISGAEVSIDVNDLCKHTNYSGAYNKDHETIKYFWEVVREFNEKQKQQLLKFVTSCSRPPLLGFSQLHPPFSILSSHEISYLPSASTCMHLLKLPMFTDKYVLKEKLLYAISSGAGFELS